MNTKATRHFFDEHFKKITAAAGVSGILGWDQETMMPDGAAAQRADQIGWISGVLHAMMTEPRWIDTLMELEQDQSQEELFRGGIRRVLRDARNSTKLPAKLVEDIARAAVTGQMAWKEARKNDKFSLFEKELEHVIGLKKEAARCLKVGNETAYETLFSEYEPDFPVARVRELFATLKTKLVPMVRMIVEKERAKGKLGGDFKMPIDTQRAMNRKIASVIGFDLNCGRLDEAAHPFCSGYWSDVRMTTRYQEGDWTNSLYSVLHETGHGIYEQGIGRALSGNPAGSASSLGLHESQSRFWENCIGRSKEFSGFMSKWASKEFGAHSVTPEQYYAQVNAPEYGYIRVDADEATYNLHIMVRFEIEEAILSGTVKTADLPALWRSKYKEYLGLPHKSDADGVLQDVHWSMGGIGYFPTYTLGNLISAQLLECIRRDLNVDDLVSRGEFAPIREWLFKKVHRFGNGKPTLEIVRAATGAELSAAPFLSYVEKKFLG